MSDSNDDNQQHNVALLNPAPSEDNKNHPVLQDLPNSGEISVGRRRLSTSTSSLQEQNASLLNDENSKNSANDIEIVIEKKEQSDWRRKSQKEQKRVTKVVIY